jgi:hypothetical protein
MVMAPRRRRLPSGLRLGAPRAIAASRLPGTETVALGGGETVPTPGLAALPVSTRSRAAGLAGDCLALPPATVRVLNDVQVAPAQGVVFTRDRRVVLDSVATERLVLLRRPRRKVPAEHRDGSVAPYGVPDGGVCEALVEALPRALLLQHPALRRYGRVEVLCPPTTAPVESWLLRRLPKGHLLVDRSCTSPLVSATRVLVPSAVTRCGAGAIPRWYDRWVADAVRGLPSAGPPQRVVLVHGGRDPLRRTALWQQLVHSCGLLPLDTAALHGEALDTALAVLRDARLIVGATDEALSHALLARRARVVEVGLDQLVSPRIAQLCLSRGLPFEFLLPGELLPRLLDGDGDSA